MPTAPTDTSSRALSATQRAGLKVLMYYPDFGQQGGIERYLENCLKAFEGNPHVELAAAVSAGGPLCQRLTSLGLKVFPISTWPGFKRPAIRFLDGATVAQLKQAIEKFAPDVIHVHIGSLENWWIEQLGIPVVYTFHGYGPLYHLGATQNPLKRMAKSALRWGFKAMAQRLYDLQFVSQAEAKRMKTEGYIDDRTPISVLHNAVDIGQWQHAVDQADVSAFLKALGIPQDAQVVSFISRLDENKNPHDFVTLAQHLRQGLPHKPLHFVMAGSGPLLPKVVSQVEALGLSECVHVLGHVQDIPALLKASSLVVHLPNQEGFGMGVLESIAAGTPCLAYQTGGIPEIFGENPAFKVCQVAPGQTHQLLEQAKTLLTQSTEAQSTLQQALIERSRAFDLSAWAPQMETTWRKAAARAPQKPHLNLPHCPLVSVVMPVYNGQDYIRQAVRSVLGQSYPHLELLVVDDGSTDSTQSILASFQDPRLKVLTQQNQGVSAARNLAVSQSQGEYIAFCDADDLWFPQKLAQDMATLLLSANPIGVSYSGYYAVDEQDRLVNLPAIPTQSGNIFETVLSKEGMLLPSLVTMHKSIVDAVGGFTADSYHEDRVFFLRVAKRFPIYATGQRLIAYRQSLSGRCRRILKDYDLALSAEQSIMQAVSEQLTPQELAQLTQIQMRSLYFRFFTYNFVPHAKRLKPSLSGIHLNHSIKGKLARLSLGSGVNFMNLARLGIQCFTRFVIHPWWVTQRASLYHIVMDSEGRYVHH